MSIKNEASIDDLLHVGGKAELVGGEIVVMSPTGGLPNYAAGEIFAHLREYARQTRRGHAVTDNAAFVVDLPGRRSLSPGAAYYVGAVTARFFQGPPRFAAEVRSEEDFGPSAEEEMAAKRADYFAAGTLVVWDVDVLKEQLVRVYRASTPLEPTIYRRGEIAEAEPAVPGWSFPVAALFLRPEDR